MNGFVHDRAAAIGYAPFVRRESAGNAWGRICRDWSAGPARRLDESSASSTDRLPRLGVGRSSTCARAWIRSRETTGGKGRYCHRERCRGRSGDSRTRIRSSDAWRRVTRSGVRCRWRRSGTQSLSWRTRCWIDRCWRVPPLLSCTRLAVELSLRRSSMAGTATRQPSISSADGWGPPVGLHPAAEEGHSSSRLRRRVDRCEGEARL
jgi:hypothetical protein